MERKTEYIKSSDGKTQLYLQIWDPGDEPRAVLQIAHGMVEFIDRYDRFARAMASEGILVVGNDHLGHGNSVTTKDNWGYFADENGNRHVLEDMRAVQRLFKERYPQLPYFLMGHSMGSFLTRQYLHTYPEDEFAAVILTGTGMQPAALVSTGMTFVKMIRAFKGPRYRSKFLTNLSLGSNNKPFKPNRTTCDWLTRDEAIVDAYVADERNQFMFTVSAFADMFEGIKTLYQKANLDKMNRDIPVLIASGADDPVGDMGKAAPAYGKQLEELGFKDVTVKLYEEGRHELVNELNYEEIYRDIASFILKYVA
ncbi:MAG: alpha/beta hydrolase [Clostridiaceae bacterium]|jgi:alpha-beta hydrolase superfamily lysophospholipase|nr:alpha/beta hydrolase [Clostridiaceae bacterium]